jgi:hypothetical protein
MPKIDINRVAEILKRNQLAPATLRAVVEEMNLLARAAIDEERPPAVKKQYVILVSDPEGALPPNGIAGWVLQIPEDAAVASTPERIFRGAYDYNASKKGRLYPVESVGEALDGVTAKHFKEAGLWVKTRSPVLALPTNDEIPRE